MEILNGYLKNICKGFVSSCRWVGERSDIARFGRGT